MFQELAHFLEGDASITFTVSKSPEGNLHLAMIGRGETLENFPAFSCTASPVELDDAETGFASLLSKFGGTVTSYAAAAAEFEKANKEIAEANKAKTKAKKDEASKKGAEAKPKDPIASSALFGSADTDDEEGNEE